MPFGDFLKVIKEVSCLLFWHSVPLLVGCKTRCPDPHGCVSPQGLDSFKPKAIIVRDEEEFGCGARQRGNSKPEAT